MEVYRPWLSLVLPQAPEIWLIELTVADARSRYLCLYWIVLLVSLQSFRFHASFKRCRSIVGALKADITMFTAAMNQLTVAHRCNCWQQCTIPFVTLMQRQLALHQIVMRKFFHALVLVMFVPAIPIHPDFVGVSFAVRLAKMILEDRIQHDHLCHFLIRCFAHSFRLRPTYF